MNLAEPFLLRQKLARVIAQACQPICKKYEINQTGFEVLMFLADHRERNTARDLCAARAVKPGLASVAVENLIRRGFLKREEDPEDRRVRRLVLTEAAGPLVAEGREIQQEFWRTIAMGIPDEELRAFYRTASKLMANIANMDKKGTQHDQTTETDA